MVRTSPESLIATPCPARSVPRMDAVIASSGTFARSATTEPSTVSRSNDTSSWVGGRGGSDFNCIGPSGAGTSGGRF